MFDDFNAILNNPPIVLHKIVCCYHMLDRDPIGNDLQKMHYINEVFSSLEKQYNNITVFDPTTAPQYIPDVYGNGIFLSDACHFTAEVNNWVAEKVIEKYCER